MRFLLLAPSNTVHTFRWATAMRDRGHNVCVVSTVPKSIPGIDSLYFQVPPFGLLWPYRWKVRTEKYLRSVIRKF